MFRGVNKTWQIIYTRGKLSPKILLFSLLYLKNSLAPYGFWLVLKWKKSWEGQKVKLEKNLQTIPTLTMRHVLSIRDSFINQGNAEYVYCGDSI